MVIVNVIELSATKKGNQLKKARKRTELVNESLDENQDGLPACNKTVLVAEDEEQVRSVIGQILEMNGYTVLEAANGVNALKLASEYTGGTIHLLIADLVMPLMSGRELAKRVSELYPAIKVLFISGYPDQETSDLEGAFISKPFTPTTLLQKVRESLGRPS